MAELAVVHTSDFHGHLPGPVVAKLRRLKADEHALLLDSGDALFLPQWLPYCCREAAVLRGMNDAGYDAMAAGNHEFFLRSRQMQRRTRAATFPVVCANLVWEGETRGNLRRWAVLQSPAGDAVGVFGLMPPMTPPGSFVERLSDMRFIPWDEAAADAVAALRPGVRWLVALLHIGPRGDEQIARAHPEIDLILAGHSHQVTPEDGCRAGACTLPTGSVSSGGLQAPALQADRRRAPRIIRSGCRARVATVVRSVSDASPTEFTRRVVELE